MTADCLFLSHGAEKDVCSLSSDIQRVFELVYSIQTIAEQARSRNTYICTISFLLLDFTLIDTIDNTHSSSQAPICPYAFREASTPFFDVSDSSVGHNFIPFHFPFYLCEAQLDGFDLIRGD